MTSGATVISATPHFPDAASGPSTRHLIRCIASRSSLVAAARLNDVPFAGGILESASPFRDVGTVLGVSGPVVGLDHPEAPSRHQAEAVGVVLHEARVGRIASAGPQAVPLPRRCPTWRRVPRIACLNKGVDPAP